MTTEGIIIEQLKKLLQEEERKREAITGVLALERQKYIALLQFIWGIVAHHGTKGELRFPVEVLEGADFAKCALDISDDPITRDKIIRATINQAAQPIRAPGSPAIN